MTTTDRAPNDRELIFTRLVDAPPAAVFAAWTDPAQLAAWWGPDGFTTTTHAMELRPGGTWRFTMHGPDGRDYENRIDYLEVRAPHLLGYRHTGDLDVEPAQFHVTVTFAALGAQTLVTMRMVFADPDELARVEATYGAVQGAIDTLARLRALLSPTQLEIHPQGDREVVMTRRFDAPRELVFEAFTRPEIVVQWLYGPSEEHSLQVCELDLRVGGRLRYVWRLPSGADMGMSGTYVEITPPARLVHTEQFEEDWTGGETLVTTDLSEVGSRTTVTMTIRYASRAARDGALRSGMAHGVAASYDRLARIVGRR